MSVNVVRVVDDEQARWLAEQHERLQAGVRIRLDPTDKDVAGHGAAVDQRVVRVLVLDDDADTEGHAITLQLPSAEEAEALRRRLVLTGVLIATVVLGGAGVALAVSGGPEASDAQASGSEIRDVSYEDVTPPV